MHGAATSLGEGAILRSVFDAGGAGAACFAVADGVDDFGLGDLHVDFACAVIQIADGDRLGAFDDLGEIGDNLVALKAGVTHTAKSRLPQRPPDRSVSATQKKLLFKFHAGNGNARSYIERLRK